MRHSQTRLNALQMICVVITLHIRSLEKQPSLLVEVLGTCPSSWDMWVMGLIDDCGIGGVFQSPLAEQIYNITKEVEFGTGIPYLYGNYTSDIMNFDMVSEMLEMDDIECKSLVGADDVLSNKNPEARLRVAGIYFMYKAAGAKTDEGGILEEVYEAMKKAGESV